MKAKAYPLDAYPKATDIQFPEILPIAYAVCAIKCGNAQFIVDGSTQVCEHCGRLMFRCEVKEFKLLTPKQEKPKTRRKAKRR